MPTHIESQARSIQRYAHNVWILIPLLAALLPGGQHARAGEAEIEGLVIDQTQTRVGAEFYRCFVLFWSAPRGEHVSDCTITITERASAQWGFWVRVQVLDGVVYQKVLKPQADDFEDEARMAVKAVQRYLETQRRGEPLNGGDLMGSGI